MVWDRPIGPLHATTAAASIGIQSLRLALVSFLVLKFIKLRVVAGKDVLAAKHSQQLGAVVRSEHKQLVKVQLGEPLTVS